MTFDRVYKSGRLVLDDNVIERIEHYCDEEIFLDEVGVLAKEKQEQLKELAKERGREERVKKFHKNVEKSFKTAKKEHGNIFQDDEFAPGLLRTKALKKAAVLPE